MEEEQAKPNEPNGCGGGERGRGGCTPNCHEGAHAKDSADMQALQYMDKSNVQSFDNIDNGRLSDGEMV